MPLSQSWDEVTIYIPSIHLTGNWQPARIVSSCHFICIYEPYFIYLGDFFSLFKCIYLFYLWLGFILGGHLLLHWSLEIISKVSCQHLSVALILPSVFLSFSTLELGKLWARIFRWRILGHPAQFSHLEMDLPSTKWNWNFRACPLDELPPAKAVEGPQIVGSIEFIYFWRILLFQILFFPLCMVFILF